MKYIVNEHNKEEIIDKVNEFFKDKTVITYNVRKEEIIKGRCKTHVLFEEKLFRDNRPVLAIEDIYDKDYCYPICENEEIEIEDNIIYFKDHKIYKKDYSSEDYFLYIIGKFYRTLRSFIGNENDTFFLSGETHSSFMKMEDQIVRQININSKSLFNKDFLEVVEFEYNELSNVLEFKSNLAEWEQTGNINFNFYKIDNDKPLDITEFLFNILKENGEFKYDYSNSMDDDLFAGLDFYEVDDDDGFL